MAGLLLGVGYSAHAWLFSMSLARLDAGLVDLLLFTYPALVMLGAVALHRERWSSRRALALGAASAGATLVLVGGLGSIDPLGAGLAFGSAIAYAAYILTFAGQLDRTDPFLLTALVTAGAAVTLTIAGAARDDVSLQVDGDALALVAVVGLVATLGMSTFVAGIQRLGPSRASMVSAVQPALTPILGFLVFADRLGIEQLLGGALIVAAIAAVESAGGSLEWLPRRERRRLTNLSDAIDFAAGSRLVRQGAEPEAFFVIESGRARVERDERHVADLDAGDFFGELALLRRGRRTASVVAATDMRVRVIAAREFVGALRRLPTLSRCVQAAAVAR